MRMIMSMLKRTLSLSILKIGLKELGKVILNVYSLDSGSQQI
jgi:hypothetical protein